MTSDSDDCKRRKNMKKRWMTAALVCVLALTGGCGKSKSTDTAKTETETGIASLYPDSKITKLGNL